MARTSRLPRRSSTPRAGARVPAASRMCALAFAPSRYGRAPKKASAPTAAAVRRERIGRSRLMTLVRRSGGTQRSGEEERLDGGEEHLRRLPKGHVPGAWDEPEPRLRKKCGELLGHPCRKCVFRPMEDECRAGKGTEDGTPIVAVAPH